MYPITGFSFFLNRLARFFSEISFGAMSIVFEGIDDLGIVPPPIRDSPSPTVIKAGRPFKDSLIMFALVSNSLTEVDNISRSGSTRYKRPWFRRLWVNRAIKKFRE